LLHRAEVFRGRSRAALLGFVCLLASLFGCLALCAAWEPIQRDGWFHHAWYRDHDLTAAEIWAFAKSNYLYSNPRLGEIVTFLSYAPAGLHRLISPLWTVATVLAVVALVLGRWPSPRDPDHVRLSVLVAAMLVASTPGAGELFCYRPVTGNYVFGFLLQLLLILPYRIHLGAPRRRGPAFAIALLGAGLLAGMTNEHTGPAVIAMLAAALWWQRRRRDRCPPWMITGLVGLVVGYLALLLAPGQSVRYTGMAAHESILDRVLARSLSDSLLVLGFGAAAAALVVPWLVVGRLARARRDPRPTPLDAADRRALWTLALAGAAMIVTLLGSPKQGWRLVYAPSVLWIASVAIWLRPRLIGRTRTILLALSVTALGAEGVQLPRVQHRLHEEFADRLARLQTARGAILTLPSYSLGRSPWFLGDEIHERAWRVVIARIFGLAMVSPVPDSGAPALVLEHQLEPPLHDLALPVPPRVAPAAFPEMRQACLALGAELGRIPDHRLRSAAYRLDALDPAALGGRPVLVCAHRDGAVIEPRAASHPTGRRTWQLELDLAGWQPRGAIDVYAITPRWTVRPATVVDGTTTVDVETPGRHHVLLCDRIECFLAGTFSR
jgi:hypothetical protein